MISMYRIVSNFFRIVDNNFFHPIEYGMYQIKFAYTFRIHEGFNFLVLLRIFTRELLIFLMAQTVCLFAFYACLFT